MRSVPLSVVLSLTLLVPAAAFAQTDQVAQWNNALLDQVRAARTPPPRATRAMAIVHVAIHDAASSIDGRYETYADHGVAPSGASIEAAIAAAGAIALDASYPGAGADLLAAQLAGVPEGDAKDDGVTWGTMVAEAIVAMRANDGAETAISYPALGGAWWWSPTPPANANALLPQWPYVTPWVMPHGAAFRTAGPPSTPADARYRKAYYEVKQLGRATGSTRSAEQTEIAGFWDDGAGTQTPPGHWMEIAQLLVDQHDLDLVDSARTMALVALTVADAAIVSWDNKFFCHHWRPVTGIRAGATDGNPDTVADPQWSSLLTTPPFPAYTSGHSTFSGSASRVLAHLFGDDQAFVIGSDGLPGVTRSFSSLSEAAEEAGQSRIYGGIHWQYDNRDGLASGRALADHVVANVLRVAAEPPAVIACENDGPRLCLQDRYLVTVDWRSSAAGPTGVGVATALGDTSGVFSFFSGGNAEVLVKILDGCPVNGHTWFFAAPATDVELIMQVTDTWTRATRTYFNPLGSVGRTIAATDAFACEI